jgi:hypothetical protein
LDACGCSNRYCGCGSIMLCQSLLNCHMKHPAAKLRLNANHTALSATLMRSSSNCRLTGIIQSARLGCLRPCIGIACSAAAMIDCTHVRGPMSHAVRHQLQSSDIPEWAKLLPHGNGCKMVLPLAHSEVLLPFSQLQPETA